MVKDGIGLEVVEAMVELELDVELLVAEGTEAEEEPEEVAEMMETPEKAEAVYNARAVPPSATTIEHDQLGSVVKMQKRLLTSSVLESTTILWRSIVRIDT